MAKIDGPSQQAVTPVTDQRVTPGSPAQTSQTTQQGGQRAGHPTGSSFVRERRSVSPGSMVQQAAASPVGPQTGPPLSQAAQAMGATGPAARPAGPSLLDPMRLDQSYLKQGSAGAPVEELQRLLNRAGIQPALEIDGSFGPRTRAAVREFQERTGCKVDGIVGPETMGAIDRALGMPGLPARGRTPDQTSPRRPGAPAAPAPSTAPVAAGPSPFGAVPARDLTREQAMRELETLQAQGRVDFDRRSSGRIRLSFPVGGVDFRSMSRSQPDRRSYGLDPRMAVATVRLAEWARSRGVSEITHRGFAGRSATDRHGQGRALDIAGFRGVSPQTGQPFDHDILRDWGRAPRRGDGFRLDPNSGAGRLFQDAYSFLTTQFRDARSPSSIGGRSYILSPDHPSPGLRRTHLDHFHIEVPPLR